MADFTGLVDTQLDPDAPLTTELAYAWRDNPIAIAEGAPNSPMVRYGWQPYDMVNNSEAGKTGLVYSFSNNGAVKTINFPELEAGYDYRIFLDNLSMTGSGERNFDFAVSGDSSTWVSLVAVTPDGNGTSSGCLDLLSPRASKSVLDFSGSFRNGPIPSPSLSVTNYAPQNYLIRKPSTAPFLYSRINIQQGGAVNPSTDGGSVYMYKRRSFGGTP